MPVLTCVHWLGRILIIDQESATLFDMKCLESIFFFLITVQCVNAHNLFLLLLLNKLMFCLFVFFKKRMNLIDQK